MKFLLVNQQKLLRVQPAGNCHKINKYVFKIIIKVRKNISSWSVGL